MKKSSLQQIFIDAAEALGFDNLLDAFLSVTATRYWLVWLEGMTLGMFTAILALNFVGFVESHLYAPAFSLAMYNIAIFLSLTSGVAVGMRVKNEGFDVSKFTKATVQGITLNIVLFVAHNMGKAEDVYLWLPITIWTAFIGINFLKWLRNLALLGVLGGDFHDVLIKQFSDKYQIKLKKDEDKSDGDNPTT